MCMNAHIDDWSDIYVALMVAKHGTLSGAADALDVHHSTVLRRINGLEEKLGTRLFNRAARGYSPTEAGLLLFKVAESTQENFDRLVGRLQGVDQTISGTLVVTCLTHMVPEFMPMFAEFQNQHPNIRLDIIADYRLLKLEYGEAHVSIRAGADPKEPDYIARHVADLSHTLACSQSYIKKYGTLRDLNDLENHRFIMSIGDFLHVPFIRWMHENIPENAVAMRMSDPLMMKEAAIQGVGIYTANCWVLNKEPRLKALIPPPEEWKSKLWLVTHKDTRRTAKVAAFKEFFVQWINRNASDLGPPA